MALETRRQPPRKLRTVSCRHDDEARRPPALTDPDPHDAGEGEQRVLMGRENFGDRARGISRVPRVGPRAGRGKRGGPEPADRCVGGQMWQTVAPSMAVEVLYPTRTAAFTVVSGGGAQGVKISTTLVCANPACGPPPIT